MKQNKQKKRRSRFLPFLVLLILLGAALSSEKTGSARDTQQARNTGVTAVATHINGAAASASDTADALCVDFLDVGQGDAAVLRCGGQTMMIDGGKPEKSDFIYSWLKKQGISYLDYMVATHPDADHIGGLSGALQCAEVGTAYCSVTEGKTRTFESLVKYLAKQGKTLTVPDAGTTFALGDAEVEVLAPDAAGENAARAAEDTNNASLVLRVTYGDTSFLFTGDAEREEEQELLDSGYDLRSTVLKVGHHGSDSSTSYRFLREVDPAYAVISVGADNAYGHPTEAVLSRLRDADVRTFRTDMQGTITAVSDGTEVTFMTERNADADTLADAGTGAKSRTYAAERSGQAAGTAGEEASVDAGETQASDTAGDGSYENEDGDEDAEEQTYVLNTNTHKFHYPDCSAVRQMKEKNKKTVTESRDEIISEGYEPCKRCHP